jgi:hypothetical protein
MTESSPLKLNTYKPMGSKATHTGFVMTLLALLAVVPLDNALGQSARINFGAYGNLPLEILAVGHDALEFGQITPGDPDVFINYNDPRAVILEITAVEYMDINVTLIPPPGNQLLREGDPDTGIGIQVKMAYYNQGAIDPEVAAAQATLVTGDMITFPALRRAGGPPGPPPTPSHAGYTPPTAKVYIIIYGTLMVGGERLKAGLYSGDIHVEVSY